MTPINFKANFLKTAYIGKTTNNKSSCHSEVSIVELDTNNKNDVEALAKTACEWNKVASGYAFEIYNEALKFKLYPDVVKEHYLALTLQNENYKNLDSNKILGLALFTEKNDINDELTWLQVNPNTNFENSKNGRKYKHIGKTLVDFVKCIADKPLYIQADDKAIKFYEKQGFRHLDDTKPSLMIFDA